MFNQGLVSLQLKALTNLVPDLFVLYRPIGCCYAWHRSETRVHIIMIYLEFKAHLTSMSTTAFFIMVTIKTLE